MLLPVLAVLIKPAAAALLPVRLDRLCTAGLYSRAACNCPGRARGGLGAASGPVDAGCGEPPAVWSHVLWHAHALQRT